MSEISNQSPEERREFLKELNRVVSFTATVLHGEDVSKGRIRQYKKYFKRTYNMLHRIADMKGEINTSSFKYGYGGKILVRKVLIKLGMIKKNESPGKGQTYSLLVSKQEIDLDLVSRIIVEVYLIRNDVSAIS